MGGSGKVKQGEVSGYAVWIVRIVDVSKVRKWRWKCPITKRGDLIG